MCDCEPELVSPFYYIIFTVTDPGFTRGQFSSKTAKKRRQLDPEGWTHPWCSLGSATSSQFNDKAIKNVFLKRIDRRRKILSRNPRSGFRLYIIPESFLYLALLFITARVRIRRKVMYPGQDQDRIPLPCIILPTRIRTGYPPPPGPSSQPGPGHAMDRIG